MPRRTAARKTTKTASEESFGCYARPGKPTDNGLIESFNGGPRDEFLNTHEFAPMQDVRERLMAWKDDYNNSRPHGSLGHLTPSELAQTRSDQATKSRPAPTPD